MVNSTKMNTRSSQGKTKVTNPVTNSVVNPVTNPVVNAPTASPSDVEAVEPIAGSSQTHLPSNANHTKTGDASTVRMLQSCATAMVYT